MNLQATVLPALLGTQIGRCSFPWGGQSLHPARALPCPVRSPQGWMQGSVVRSPGWGCPRSACAHPALLFLVLWVRWPGRTVYLVGPAGETGRRVVTVLLALVTQAWLSCSHPNQLYTQVSAWLKPPVSPPFWALAHSVYPTRPPGSPRAVQVLQLQGFETNSSSHKPQRGLLGDSWGTSRTEEAHGHTGFRRVLPRADRRLPAGCSPPRPVPKAPCHSASCSRSHSLQREAGIWAWGGCAPAGGPALACRGAENS